MSIYSQISSNQTKTYVIMGLFVLFVTTVGYVFGQALGFGDWGILLAFVISLATSVGSFYFSDSMVLAIAGAKEMQNTPGQDIFDVVQNLALASGLPAPKVYLIQDSSPNAFATGRDPKHASIAVTSGLLELLDKTELEGVIAHEMSHIKNFDTRLMVIVSVLVGTVALLGNWFMRSLWRGGNRKGGQIFLLLGILFAIFSPIIATLIQLAISRRREFLADASGALLTRYPEGLARALQKLEQNQTDSSFANNATAHLFIVNPFGEKSKAWLSNLFQTHPPLEERIKALRQM